MRPRHVLILVALGALPIALAIVLTGGGRSSVPGGAGLGNISLQLVGGDDAGTVTACGNSHHYHAYTSKGTIQFRGAISPRGGWSVALKLKACYGGAFQSAGDIPATVDGNGAYHGSFPAPIGGYYFARAELLRSGALVTRSNKRYFEVR
jgi:hypothetical protein